MHCRSLEEGFAGMQPLLRQVLQLVFLTSATDNPADVRGQPNILQTAPPITTTSKFSDIRCHGTGLQSLPIPIGLVLHPVTMSTAGSDVSVDSTNSISQEV